MFTIPRAEAREIREYALRATVDIQAARHIIQDLRVGLGQRQSSHYEPDTYDALLLHAKRIWSKMDLPVDEESIGARLADYAQPSRERNKFLEKLGQSLETYLRCPDSARASRSLR